MQAHHEDYSKPLDVQWLCMACHRGAHAWGGNMIDVKGSTRPVFLLRAPSKQKYAEWQDSAKQSGVSLNRWILKKIESGAK